MGCGRGRAMSAERESARLAALARYGVLDTPREAVFDRITEMASVIYGAPMAAIALVDAERVWFKSRVGLDVAEVSADVSFCTQAIRLGTPHIVHDASPAIGPAKDLVKFYAGAPLQTPDGHCI